MKNNVSFIIIPTTTEQNKRRRNQSKSVFKPFVIHKYNKESVLRVENDILNTIITMSGCIPEKTTRCHIRHKSGLFKASNYESIFTQNMQYASATSNSYQKREFKKKNIWQLCRLKTLHSHTFGSISVNDFQLKNPPTFVTHENDVIHDTTGYFE